MSQTQDTKSIEVFSDQELDAQTLQKMSKQLQNILEMRGDLTLKVAKRVTFLTRFIMIMFGTIAISLLVFVFIIGTRVTVLTDTVTTMNQLFGTMTADMVVMRKHVATMEVKMRNMPSMQKNLISMDKTMIEMNGGTKHMASNMQVIRQDMDKMNLSVNKMDGSFSQTQDSLLKMESDVDRISRPMRIFNKMIGR